MSATHRRFTTILQILCGIQAVLVLTQAILAGHMLSGNGSMVSVHEALGTTIITSLALGQIVAAVLLWRPGRGPIWPVPTTAALFGLIVLQLGWGFDGRLALHVPVGVTLLGAQVALVAALSNRLPATTLRLPEGTSVTQPMITRHGHCDSKAASPTPASSTRPTATRTSAPTSTPNYLGSPATRMSSWSRDPTSPTGCCVHRLIDASGYLSAASGPSR